MKPRLLFLLMAALLCGATWGQPVAIPLQRQLDRILESLGLPAGVLPGAGERTLVHALSPHTSAQRTALLNEAMAAPLQMPALAESIERDLARAASSPAQVLHTAIALHQGPHWSAPPPREGAWSCASDPLAAVMAEVFGTVDTLRGQHDAVQEIRRTWPLRVAVARMVSALAAAEVQRLAALRRLPAQGRAARVLAQLLSENREGAPQDDYRTMLSQVDRVALYQGMGSLALAVESLDHALSTMVPLPAVDWRWNTPLGEIVVDTTGRASHHVLRGPLLVVDVGGDDTYRFEPPADAHRIHVLLDRGGNDRYVALAPGSDPSSAVMGYGVLWDAEGDDRYEGGQFTQGAALLGAALHVDRAGRNHYQAQGYAQAFAAGGMAVLVGGPQDDHYEALTHAQASAGPQGIAILLEPGGDDRYVLGSAPLVLPSSQLPTHNVSMGQGAARGERAGSASEAVSGGIAVLLDLQGDDRYSAQVFAQGAGYFEGVGLLIDAGGRDAFEAAWYAMGAAAHHAVGVLVKRGQAADHYAASHSTSLGAAHDYSVALFVDEGGDDTYALGSLGLGASHDNSVAVFLELGGDDRYRASADPCNVLGAVVLSESTAQRLSAPAFALFADNAGTDLYDTACTQVGNDRLWQGLPKTTATPPPGRAFGVDARQAP